MRYRSLGRTGFKVSELGFGAWALGESWWGKQDENESVRALHRAVDLGANFIDTAAVYGDGRSERILGRFRKERKEPLIIATKTPLSGGTWPPTPYGAPDAQYSADYIRRNVEERLRNLGVDCLDVLQLHTWTRAWNRNPTPFETLRRLREEGKIRAIGVSTPEHDQNCVIDLMRGGWVDVVQVIYNLFEQEPAAELLPVAQEHNVGIIVRVAFDEGSLTGKFRRDTEFPEGDFRAEYFRGPRLKRTLDRVDRIKADLEGSEFSIAQAALKFALQHPAVGTVIPGIRNAAQADANLAVSEMPLLSEPLMEKLRLHNWRRSIWYPGNW